jgi:uncharacterized phage protein (TIGR01671 family)
VAKYWRTEKKRKAVSDTREILFRGKSVDEGKWIHGHYVHQYGADMIYLPDGVDHEYGFDYYHIIPETVGQYAGLTDKNGSEIFEGDIVAGAAHWLGRMKNGVVAFKDGAFGLIWYRGEMEQFNPFTSMCNITYEVIGNIHDNPELLKGE